MVIAPIAAAAAPTVVASATDDEGLINRLFKIAVLVGVLVLAAISIVILSFIIEIADLVGAVGNVLGIAIRVFTVPGSPLGFFGSVITGALAAFGFFGRRS